MDDRFEHFSHYIHTWNNNYNIIKSQMKWELENHFMGRRAESTGKNTENQENQDKSYEIHT